MRPLRDRLLSNTSDPIKSSILRESGHGWNPSPTPSPPASTSPLRIAKRDTPSALARRSSSSYKHVRNNHLVSNSPFKSLIPTSSAAPFPSVTRRVSGEKRPRPSSMSEQAENERPFASKRERRQSKTFQNLMEKEPVTKSPFKVASSNDEQESPQLPPRQIPGGPLARGPIPTFPVLAVEEPNPGDSFLSGGRLSPSSDSSHPAPVSAESNTSDTQTQETPAQPTPTRSSLVSRRMHGPRSSGSVRDSFGRRRSRRKTVTFDERCDVVEFEPEDDEESGLEEDDEELGFFEDPHSGLDEGDHEEPGDSYEGVPPDAEHSLSFETIFSAAQSSHSDFDDHEPQSLSTSAYPFSLPTSTDSKRAPTPPKSRIRLGSSEKNMCEMLRKEQDDSFDEIPLDGTIPTQSTPPLTPLRSRVVSATSVESFGKSTHTERVRATPDAMDPELKAERAPSRSPIIGRNKASGPSAEKELTAKLGLSGDQGKFFRIFL